MREIRGTLLRWYRRHKRDLPWRRTRDPYAIWVSEVMLQQTRVAVVVPYYERFLARFPDVRSLARASEEDVLALWSGLGYYRRARALREGARAVVVEHGGTVPRDPDRLRGLPGIGRYTAGAIASLAFGLPEPVLDGNVRRVLARVLGRPRPREAALWELVGDLVRGDSPGDFNQALMELGATVCTPDRPRCDACPIAVRCAALARGRTNAIPAAKKRPAAQRVRVAVAVVEIGDAVVLERRHPENPLRGSWELPAIEIGAKDDPRSAIRRLLARRGLTVRVGERRAEISHSILNRRLAIEAYACRLLRGRADGERLRVVRRSALDATAVSGATRKILLGQERPAGVAPTGTGSSSHASASSKAASGSGSSARASR